MYSLNLFSQKALAAFGLFLRPNIRPKVFRTLFLFGAFVSLSFLTGCSSDLSGNVEATGQSQNGISGLNARGRDIYMGQCAECHALDGTGVPEEVGSLSLEDCVVCDNREILANYIDNFMPWGDDRAKSCVGQCSVDVAEYVIYKFYLQIDDANDPINFNQAGLDVYNEQCTQCHGDDGLGLGQYPALVNCARCNSLSVLSTYIDAAMPIGGVGGQGVDACVGDCAANVAEYVLYQFNSSSQISEIQGLGVLPPEETYRKASLILTGQLPNTTHVNTIASAPTAQDKEVALSNAVDDLVNSEDFLVFLGDAINDMLLSRKYLSRNGNSKAALNLISRGSKVYGDKLEDYPNREWYEEAGLGDDPEYYARVQTNDAIAEEIVELVKYIVRNDRPFTELVTASYTMVNWYSGNAYGVDVDDLDFRRLSSPEYSELPYDPDHFIPVDVISNPHTFGDSIPHSGVLTSPMFLNRYDTTATNRNRHRARIIFDYFLDTDILAIAERANTDDISDGENPTMENPACTVCHTILDPVAGALHNWIEGGKYRRTSLDDEVDRNYNNWNFKTIFPIGFNGVGMDFVENQNNSVQWLAQRIIRDPRFIRAMTRWAYRSLTGEEPIKVEDDQNTDQVDAFMVQSQILNDIGQEFKKAGWNVKTLFKALVMSPYWRATSVTDETVTSITDEVGAHRLLTPELMHRKILAVLDVEWKDFDVNNRSSLQNLVRLYGGIDSDNITSRLKEPNGLIALIQDRYATELACAATAHDFAKPQNQRLLFTTVELETTPSESNIGRIRQTIQHLHYHLLGEKLALEDPEIQATYDLLNQVWQAGTASIAEDDRYIPRRCRSTLGSRDRSYMVTSWMAVMTYLLSDFSFAYE